MLSTNPLLFDWFEENFKIGYIGQMKLLNQLNRQLISDYRKIVYSILGEGGFFKPN